MKKRKEKGEDRRKNHLSHWTITATSSVAIKLLAEHALVMQELVVINEALRISGGVGILRRTKQDIQVNGYTIPKDWSVFLFSSAVFMNPDIYKDHLAFNPW
ncbi:hypothetical protein POPTR_004G151800v4 [Populus trichocarpa]|uniref:Uncharacterized protein n=1 Tax=Populus trichocarpa TaxID=3694 RepID=A0A3N7ETE1_POPTR|nr:hypothetical protein POPTR_004G151800v4 [Populus trichocarpa]